MKAIRTPDLFAVIMGLCAIGLVAIPELVYVRDIYENGNARANTHVQADLSGIHHVWNDDGVCDLPTAVCKPQEDPQGGRCDRTCPSSVGLRILWYEAWIPGSDRCWIRPSTKD